MGARFNQNILGAARRLKDQRTDATGSGDTDVNGNSFRYSSVLLSEYQNRAIKDIVEESLASLGRNQFQKVMPEMVQQQGLQLSAGGSTATRPSDCLSILEMVEPAGIRTRIDVDVLKITNQLDQLNSVDSTDLWYVDGGTDILFYPPVTSTAPSMRYVRVHPTLDATSNTDILLNPSWDGKIVDRMVDLALKDTFAQAPKQ